MLPRTLQEDVIIEGNIYYFENNSTFGVPAHMHGCVKRANRLLFFATCSSQINTALRLSQLYKWDINTFPVFKKDDTNKFKESLTYVNCNRCYEITVPEFVDLIEKGEIRLMKGSFTESDLQLITKGIMSSTQISREIKELFKVGSII